MVNFEPSGLRSSKILLSRRFVNRGLPSFAPFPTASTRYWAIALFCGAGASTGALKRLEYAVEVPRPVTTRQFNEVWKCKYNNSMPNPSPRVDGDEEFNGAQNFCRVMSDNVHEHRSRPF